MMNERIKALAKDAGYYLYDLTETHQCKTVETDSTDEWITLEKFAELIVKDCASICEINGQSYKHSFTTAKARLAESTSNHCAMMIKKHFGVEE